MSKPLKTLQTLANIGKIISQIILTIAIPMGALILEGIAFGIYQVFYPMAEQLNMEDSTSIGMGIMFIVASVIFKYGAELLEKGSLFLVGNWKEISEKSETEKNTLYQQATCLDSLWLKYTC